MDLAVPSVLSTLREQLKRSGLAGDPTDGDGETLDKAVARADRGRFAGCGEGIPELPQYVRDCEDYVRILELRNIATGELVHVPARCRSWRCWRCAFVRAWHDTKRIYLGAIGKAVGSGVPVAYAVLTLDRAAEEARGVNRTGSYRELLTRWNRLRQGCRYHGLIGEFVVTVEQHLSGWPHLNLLMTGGYAEAVAAGAWKEARQDLRTRAMRAGFGPVIWLDENAASASLFHYVAKYLNKSKQVPTAAPRGFRRIRASAKTLATVETSMGEAMEFVGFLSAKEREAFLEEYLRERMPEEEAVPLLMDLTRPRVPGEVAF